MNKIVIVFLLSLICDCKEKQGTQMAFNYPQDKELKASILRGQELYGDMCITCHLDNGKGVPSAFPPLAGSDFLKNNQDLSIKGIKYGMSGEIQVNGVTYNNAMATMGLSDEEVADVMNYINNSWGNAFGPMVTPQKVTKITP